MAKFMGRSRKFRPDNVLLVINRGHSVPVFLRKGEKGLDGVQTPCPPDPPIKLIRLYCVFVAFSFFQTLTIYLHHMIDRLRFQPMVVAA